MINSSPLVRSAARPAVICITPVKNEAWILDAFLRGATEWADEIILADQCSTDDSLAIARSFSKVRIISNSSKGFNEPERQSLLISAAREKPGPKIIIAIDADEMLSPAWQETADWQRVLSAPAGSAFGLRWLNVGPDFTDGSDGEYAVPCIYIDDGRPHVGAAIHSPRIPVAAGATVVALGEIRLLHFNFVDSRRLAAKRRWYMCLERIKFPEKSLVQIHDKYDYAGVHSRIPRSPIPDAWLERMAKMGVSAQKLCRTDADGFYWYDREVRGWLEQYGADKFAYLPIWEEGLPWADCSWPAATQWKQRIFFGLLRARYRIWARIFLSLLRRVGV